MIKVVLSAGPAEPRAIVSKIDPKANITLSEVADILLKMMDDGEIAITKDKKFKLVNGG
jgi:hypothetical protein